MTHPRIRSTNLSVDVRNDFDLPHESNPFDAGVARGQIVTTSESQRKRGMYSSGLSVLCTAQNQAQIATFRSDTGSRNLAAILRLAAIDEEQNFSPLAIPPQLFGPHALNSTPAGGVVLVAGLSYGTDGMSVRQYFNVISGEVVRFPFVGETGQLMAQFQPRYYYTNDNFPVTGRTYSVGRPDLGPSYPLTNANWNFPDQNQLTQTLGALASQNAVFTRGCTLYGSINEASAFSTSSTIKIARRIFFGSVPFGGPTQVICPVAYGSRTVRLVGPTSANQGVQMNFRGPTQVSVVGAGPLSFGDVGAFSANVDVPIPAETTSIVVSYLAGAVPTLESAFELHYYMSM